LLPILERWDDTNMSEYKQSPISQGRVFHVCVSGRGLRCVYERVLCQMGDDENPSPVRARRSSSNEKRGVALDRSTNGQLSQPLQRLTTMPLHQLGLVVASSNSRISMRRFFCRNIA